MSHLTEANLVLYRQDDAPDRARLAQHLAGCERCRAELEVLDRVLALVEEDSSPARDAAYGLRVWNAIEPRLDRQSELGREVAAWWTWWPVTWRGWLRLSTPPAVLAAGVAALLVVSFNGAGRPPLPVEAGSDPVLVAAVEEHLERTSLMLTELNNAEEPNEVADVHAVADDLVSDNRLYRQSAALAGDQRIGRLLDDLERVLLEVAHAPAGPRVTASDVETLRGRLDTRGVAQQVRLASAELRARELPSDIEASAAGL